MRQYGVARKVVPVEPCQAETVVGVGSKKTHMEAGTWICGESFGERYSSDNTIAVGWRPSGSLSQGVRCVASRRSGEEHGGAAESSSCVDQL
jgi:hypothetical protein